MGYLPRKTVEKSIRTRVRKGREGKPHTDYEAYMGVDPFTHQPVRLTRASEDELRKAIQDFYARHQYGGDAAVRLTAMQAIDAKNALDALADAQVDTTLYDAVRQWLGALEQNQVAAKKTVDEAFDEYFKQMVEGAHKNNTMAKTGKWAKTLAGRLLTSLTAKEIIDYLEDNYGKRAPKTYNSHLLYIKTFLNWCCKDERKYLGRNPIRSVAFKPEPWKEPEYMKPEDVERLFRLLEANKDKHPEMLAYAIVSFFCGCRAVEIQRMAEDPDAAKIDIEGVTVRIAKAKGYQQGKRPRAFHINPTALAWMKSFDFITALHKATRDTQIEMYGLARENGIPVFQNCGRHTFITYHVAAYGDPAKTTAMVGTSDKMRADNYCGLAAKEQGEAYFAIMPKAG